MKVLWVLPKWPYPALDGAKKAHMSLLKNWPSDIHLDLVVYVDNKKTDAEIAELKQQIGFENILLLPFSRVPRVLSLFGSFILRDALPITVKRFSSKNAKKLWQSWSSNKKWDLVIFDGLHPAGLFFNKSNTEPLPFARKICLRAHNVETELWEQAYNKSSIWLKWIYKNEKERMENFEKSFLNQCDLVAPVSEIDAKKISAINDQTPIIVTPIGMDFSYIPQPMQSIETFDILFIGRMDWYPNVDGLLWFLNEVWPNLLLNQNKSFKLHVVGGHMSKGLRQQLLTTPGVIVHGQVQSVEPYYNQVVLSIIPIFWGSGTRVKVIESALFGRSFISSTKGIEGVDLTSGVDFIEANTKDEWIKRLEDLSVDRCRSLGDNLHHKMKDVYDSKLIQERFVSIMASACSKVSSISQ